MTYVAPNQYGATSDEEQVMIVGVDAGPSILLKMKCGWKM
jgi:hypothetical protein